jgi:hypothetical protein
MWQSLHENSLPEGWVIHHKDGDPLNNSVDNLMPLSRADHQRVHHVGQGRSPDEAREAKRAEKKRWYQKHRKAILAYQKARREGPERERILISKREYHQRTGR